VVQWLRVETHEREVMGWNPKGRKDAKEFRTLDFFSFLSVPNLRRGFAVCPTLTHDKHCRVSRLTYGKASSCDHNLTVSKGKFHRERVCRVFFAVSNTRQSLRHVRFGLCRVRQAHGEPTPPSASEYKSCSHPCWLPSMPGCPASSDGPRILRALWQIRRNGPYRP